MLAGLRYTLLEEKLDISGGDLSMGFLAESETRTFILKLQAGDGQVSIVQSLETGRNSWTASVPG